MIEFEFRLNPESQRLAGKYVSLYAITETDYTYLLAYSRSI